MKRRDFLTNIALSTLPTFLGGFPIKAFGANPILSALAGANQETDHVLVLIQLNGGNDGLNTLIPINQYRRRHIRYESNSRRKFYSKLS